MPLKKFWRRGLSKKGKSNHDNKSSTTDNDMGTPPIKKAPHDDMGTPPVIKAQNDNMGMPPLKKAPFDDTGMPPIKKAQNDNMGTPPTKKALFNCSKLANAHTNSIANSTSKPLANSLAKLSSNSLAKSSSNTLSELSSKPLQTAYGKIKKTDLQNNLLAHSNQCTRIDNTPFQSNLPKKQDKKNHNNHAKIDSHGNTQTNVQH